MATTTVRVDLATHAELVELSASEGTSLMQTVRDAAAALRRERFGRQVAAELAELRGDDAAWAEYLADAGATSVNDGID